MTRFFITPQELSADPILLTGQNFNHAKVLRLKAGEQVLVCDGQNAECLCAVEAVLEEQMVLSVLERRQASSEAAVRVSIYMAFPKADKLEHVIQKATELGACEIVAFPSGRCVSRPDNKSLAKKLERWQKIAVSAAEQSGRGRIPAILALASFDEAVKRAAQTDLPLLFYENERTCSMRSSFSGRVFSSAAVMTGPEGGLTQREVQTAADLGMTICSLGPRILRCETAPLCALTALLYESGDLD